MFTARIVSVGTELVLGRTIDTNAPWLAAELAALGVRTSGHLTVGDDRPAIRDAIRWGCDGADVAIVTGGLGPTSDDLTREALADVLGAPLESRPELVSALEAFFAARKREMPRSNLEQAKVPRGAEPLENRWGTAPGLHAILAKPSVAERAGAQARNSQIFCLPGVPYEMREMFNHHVRPHLTAVAGGEVIVECVIQTYGGGEAEIGEKIADLMARGRNPDVGTTAKDAVIAIRITACAPSRAAAEALIASDERVIRQRLGRWVLGDGDATLERVVGELLVAAHRTVATAESCTGGLIAKRLTDVPGSSRYFLGGFVTYANTAKTLELGVPPQLIAAHGAVSEAVAVAMARGCRQRSGADFALSVTGIAGPDGGTTDKPVGLVYIALAAKDETVARELRLGDHLDRGAIRDRGCKAALDLLRLGLLDST